MHPEPKRYRAFISYSQRDKPIARRIHRVLESYRIPKGISAPVGPDRALGRFFRDDDEMGASRSLGAALEGALDDSENLIVICSPAAAQSKWVEAEVRRFKRRGGAHVFAVIAAGEPHAGDPSRECFPPSLKVKIGADGNPTGEPDEPRAPNLQHEGMQRVRVQLAAGLLDIPFDALWQRDRRRALRNRTLLSGVGLLVLAVLAVAGFGWLTTRTESRKQSARQALALARSAAAGGRIMEALTSLSPFLKLGDTRELVEDPLRALLGWVPDPSTSIQRGRITVARLRDALVLLDPDRGAYDVSDVGLSLQRLIRSRDGWRLVAIGDQRIVVFDIRTGARLAQVDNSQVTWLGHAFEAPSRLLLVGGAVLGPTNGTVVPYLLSVSADGKTVQHQEIRAHMLWGSSVGVTPKCDAFLLATETDGKVIRIERRELGADRIGDATELRSSQAGSQASNGDDLRVLAPFGAEFPTRNAFLAETARNPFTASGCGAPALDDGFAAGSLEPRVQVLSLEPGLAVEPADHWTEAAAGGSPPTPSAYVPSCTEAHRCRVVGGLTDETYARDELPITVDDQVGPPPLPRWSRWAARVAEPIYFDHRLFNSYHSLAVCRPREGTDVCLSVRVGGEDQLNLPFLRSPDGRYLFWPFGGAVFDLETLQPLTAVGAIPRTQGMHFDFEIDRPGLTLAFDGRLVSFVAETAGGWTRVDEERASPTFGVLSGEANAPPLNTLASLGSRQYLAVRKDGTLARLDARTGQELWRVIAVGQGEIQDVQLNPERRHVVLIGKDSWRVFRLSDGIALSDLLVAPPALETPAQAATCHLSGVPGPEGQLVANCGTRAFAWQPRMFKGDVAPRLARLTCAADLKTSALDTVRRCYVVH
jgi:hypothetical protein